MCMATSITTNRCLTCVAAVLLAAAILLPPVAGQETSIQMNGGFERSEASGAPLGWSLIESSGTDNQAVEATLTGDAWRGKKALLLESNGTGEASATLEMPIGFAALRMLFLGTAQFYYKALYSEIGGSNLLFSIDLLDENGKIVTTVRFSPPSDHIGDGKWHRHEFNVDILKSRRATAMRIEFSVNGGEEKAQGAWIVDEVQIYAVAPSLTFTPLICHRALVGQGETFQVGFNVSNVGGAFFYDLHSILQFDHGLKCLGDEEKIISVVEPGIIYNISWTLVAEGTGVYFIRARNWGPGNETLNPELMAVTVAAADIPPAKERFREARYIEREGDIILANPDIRLDFPTTDNGFGLFSIRCWNGAWSDMGVTLPIGHVLYVSDAGRKEVLLLTPRYYQGGQLSDSAWLQLWGNATDADGVRWSFTYRFFLSSGQPHVDIGFAVVVSRERKVLRLSVPQVLAGEGSFGASRDAGLFCGLEYLLPGERSSGTDFVDPPKNLRTVPNPLKVTTPLMAVERNNATIALSWNPGEKWDGRNAVISAKYLSPNWVQNQSNHLMALFIPTVPDWVEENHDEAFRPYTMTGAIRINFRIYARSGDIIDAYQWWLRINGAPELPKKPRSYQETIDLCTKCFKDICWVPEAKAWRHTHLKDPRWIFWDPLVALPLWHESALTENLTLREEIRSQVLQALEARGGLGATLDLSLHLGELDKTLATGYTQVDALVDSQREDGSWPFAPAYGKERLGKVGDTSSGWVASKARFLLKFGRITGDSEAIRAGLKALDYLDTQKRPEGAQTWELQLHVPDVLASSYVTECYLEAYKITDDPKYLEKAKYWALTGLPFIYTWNPPDRPIMRYGSIPVFGASMFTNPWFGIIVQWNGLDYAYRLYDLSRYDDSLPWKAFAEGITICGMQMQRYPGGPHDEVLGMYPDGYSAVEGKDAYYFDINPRFIALDAFALMGDDETTQTKIVDVAGHRVHFSTVGHLLNAGASGKGLSFDVQYPEGDTSFALVGGVSKPSSVTVNGRVLNEADDLSSVPEGWTFRPEGVLLIKILHSATDHVEMEGITPQANQRFAPVPQWDFEESAEGWTSANMLTPFEIKGGILSSASTGSDPYMVGPSVQVEGRRNCSVEVRMSVTAGSMAQIFWTRKDSPYFSEGKSMTFGIVPDGQFHTYMVRLGDSPEWKGTIRHIRFDPTNAKDSEIRIDYIRVKEDILVALLASLLLMGLGRPNHG